MPKLTIPIAANEPLCDVLIGLDGKTTTGLKAAGLPILRPVHGRGVIDTGATMTSVSPLILRQLGLNTPTIQTKTTGLTGSVRVDLFEVGLCIFDRLNPSAPMHVLPDLLVMELPAPLDQIDVLIGMDILLTTRFVLDGASREFTLEF